MRKDRAYNNSDKFIFSLGFQLEVLRFLIQGKESTLIIDKIKPGYFTLIEHSIIMEGLSSFFRKKKRIPSEPVLVEVITELLHRKDFVDLVTKDDIPNIISIIRDLYNTSLKDQDIISEKIHEFVAYIEMKVLNNSMDFSDFSKYSEYQSKVAKIISSSRTVKEEDPLLMVQGVNHRQLLRQVNPDVVPTPYWQLNKLSNGDGYSKGSIFVLLDKPKAKKTFALVNTARGYLGMRKNVLYIDLENGKRQIMDRMVQSTMNKTKLQMLSGDFDKVEQRHMRKYKRLGVEFIVERLPALVADANSIKNLITKIKNVYGITIDVLMVDYAAKLASIARDKEDVARINNVYIDLDNLAFEMGLDAIWTAQHITREGAKHRGTKYDDVDIASAISIVRNAQCIMGLNATEEEEANGVQRLEVVVQRDGKPSGRCLFNINNDTQRWKEFTRDARAKYDETKGKEVDEAISREQSNDKPKLKKRSNPNSDPEKVDHRTGDI